MPIAASSFFPAAIRPSIALSRSADGSAPAPSAHISARP